MSPEGSGLCRLFVLFGLLYCLLLPGEQGTWFFPCSTGKGEAYSRCPSDRYLLDGWMANLVFSPGCEHPESRDSLLPIFVAPASPKRGAQGRNTVF